MYTPFICVRKWLSNIWLVLIELLGSWSTEELQHSGVFNLFEDLGDLPSWRSEEL